MCVLLLALFVLICGVHLASVHHDTDMDSLGVSDSLAQLGLLAVVAVGLALLIAYRRMAAPRVPLLLLFRATDPSFGAPHVSAPEVFPLRR